jgi:hypothetical protein
LPAAARDGNCGAYCGSFWYLSSNGDAVVEGLAAFDCRSAYGALCDEYARVRVLGCNFTSQTGAWWTYGGYAAVIYQTNTGSSTKTEFTLFKSCTGGRAILYLDAVNAATFVHSTFDGCVAVISHYSSYATGQDDIRRCFINNTPLIAEGSFRAEGGKLFQCWDGDGVGLPLRGAGPGDARERPDDGRPAGVRRHAVRLHGGAAGDVPGAGSGGVRTDVESRREQVADAGRVEVADAERVEVADAERAQGVTTPGPNLARKTF